MIKALLILALICPVCKELGEKSTVHPYGASTCTLMAPVDYYDEDGNHVYHDPNSCTYQYRCSKGHEFSRVVPEQQEEVEK
jgi:hypothetical protein